MVTDLAATAPVAEGDHAVRTTPARSTAAVVLEKACGAECLLPIAFHTLPFTLTVHLPVAVRATPLVKPVALSSFVP